MVWYHILNLWNIDLSCLSEVALQTHQRPQNEARTKLGPVVISLQKLKFENVGDWIKWTSRWRFAFSVYWPAGELRHMNYYPRTSKKFFVSLSRWMHISGDFFKKKWRNLNLLFSVSLIYKLIDIHNLVRFTKRWVPRRGET